MIFSPAKFLLLLLLGAMLLGLSGCATTDEPDNLSVRPWNSPQNWENGLGGMNTQHQ